MPLSRFTFIVKAPGYAAHQHRAALTSDEFSTQVIGVSDLAAAIEAARQQAEQGTQLIELCGGFTPQEAAELRRHLPPTVPVGVVAYDAQQQSELERLFS
jgi:hypothetical protein